MGFRHYFGIIEKQQSETIRNFTLDELKTYAKQPNNVLSYDEYEDEVEDILYIFKAVFELGKLYYCKTHERITIGAENFFINEEINEHYCDYEMLLVGKRGIELAVESYEKDLSKSFKEDLEKLNELDYSGNQVDFNEELIKIDIRELLIRYQCMIEQKLFELEATDYKRETRLLTQSDTKEYARFDLIYLLKTLDFDKYDVVLFAY